MQSHSFQNYHQVSRVITGSRLNRLRINLCINITIAAITGVITSIQKPRSFASASHIDQHAYCSRDDRLPMDVLRAVPGENTIHPRLPDHQNQSRGLHSVHVPVRSDLHPCRHHEKNTDRQGQLRTVVPARFITNRTGTEEISRRHAFQSSDTTIPVPVPKGPPGELCLF